MGYIGHLNKADEIGSIAIDVLPTTICTSNLRQCHALPLTKRLFLWGGS
jgi:hypothetical protein